MIEVGSNNVYYASDSPYSSWRLNKAENKIFLSYTADITYHPNEYLMRYERRLGRFMTNLNIKFLTENGETQNCSRNTIINEFPMFYYIRSRETILTSGLFFLEGKQEKDCDPSLMLKNSDVNFGSLSSGFRSFNSQLSTTSHVGILPPVDSEIALKDLKTNETNWKTVCGHGINHDTKQVYIEYLSGDSKKRFHIDLSKKINLTFRQVGESIEHSLYNSSFEEH